MSRNIWSTNLRFNLDKDTQRRAWEYLQTMDRQVFKSYSQVIALSLVDYFERYYRRQDDPYLETREKEDQFVSRIVEAVQVSMEKTLPLFLAGCMAGTRQKEESQTKEVTFSHSKDPEMDIDWDFLGE